MGHGLGNGLEIVVIMSGSTTMSRARWLADMPCEWLREPQEDDHNGWGMFCSALFTKCHACSLSGCSLHHQSQAHVTLYLRKVGWGVDGGVKYWKVLGAVPCSQPSCHTAILGALVTACMWRFRTCAGCQLLESVLGRKGILPYPAPRP